jgi:pyruvate dehydrogenase E1 component beta subunit
VARLTRVLDLGEALGLALREEMRRDPRVYVIGEDVVLGVPFGVTRGLVEEFGPDRVLNAPISEAAIVGSAVGAAMTGLVPVVDMHFADFVTCAMDEVVNQLAKSRYMFGGQLDCPLTLRMPYGIGKSAGGHHSNSVEAWFVNTPGLKVCIPSTPADARGLLKTAIRDPDPVLVFEHRGLYRVQGEVPVEEALVPLGVAEVRRPGRDVTVVATARMVGESLAAARRLAEEGIEVEVVDPRSLVPLDRETLAASVARTHRVVIAEEGPMRGSVGAWLAWVVMEDCFDELDAPIARVAAPNVPVPFSPPLEAFVTPGAEQVAAAVRQALK